MHTTSARYRPFAGGYVSEADQFLSELLHARPALVDDQRRGWYLLWDKRVDLDALEQARADTVPVKPYHYE